MSLVARRYAQAAIDAARIDGGADAVDTLVNSFSTFAMAGTDSAAFAELQGNPAFAPKRQALLNKIVDDLKLPSSVAALLRVLETNDRLAELSDLQRHLRMMADQSAGRVQAHVRSAIELQPAQRDRLQKALEKQTGLSVILTTECDPSVMGGLVCEVGTLTIDNSVKRQVELLGEQLLTAH